jgi:hypothetical protein
VHQQHKVLWQVNSFQPWLDAVERTQPPMIDIKL